ncbi:MAG: Integral membrane protein TerC, partial [uncultured Gemmatimonadetes bacterium]
GDEHLVLDRIQRVRAADAGAGPGRVPPQGARGEAARGRHLERHLGGRGAVVQRGHLLPGGQAARAGVPDGVPGGEVAGGGQHLRHRHDLLVLRGALHLPAPRPLLGDPGRAGDARRLHRHGCVRAGALALDHLRLRRAAAGDGDQDGAQKGRRPLRRRAEPGGALRPAVHPAHVALRRAEVLDGGEREARGHAPLPGAAAGGGERPGVRHRLDPGDLRDYQGPVPGLHLQRVRHPGAAVDVLPARRGDAQVHVPQVRPERGAGVRGRQDDADRPVQDPHGRVAGRDRHADRRLHRGLLLGLQPGRAGREGAGKVGGSGSGRHL